MRSILLAGVLIAVLGTGVFALASRSTAEDVPAAAAPAAADTAAPAPAPADAQAPVAEAMTERALGRADAPLVLDEYFALTCPHCAHFHKDILPRLKADYIDTGKVRLVFHDFIFNEIGLKAAMVARCVKPDSYYEFSKTLFEMQEAWSAPSGGEDVLKQVAGFAGLAPARYDACVGDKALSDWLLQGRVDAMNNLNVNSTPTFLIRGSLERIVGAQDYDEFKTAIDRQLAKLVPAAPAAP